MREELLAAVDLGSNSFRLLIGKEEAGQIVAISAHREGVRLAAGLNGKNKLSEEKIGEAVQALSRFRERLQGVASGNIRAVATSTYRVASNRDELLRRSEAALGVPIDIVSGQEEARLIYLGCAHSLPWSEHDRIIIDIGGGSTEFIVGHQYSPDHMESFPLGAVTLSQHFFPEATVTASSFRKAELFVRSRLEVLPDAFKRGWGVAYGSSGTIRALHEIITENQLADAITRPALERLRDRLVEAGDVLRVNMPALKASRAAVLPGGIAILLGLMYELNIDAVEPAEGALRLGVLYDQLNRRSDDGNSAGFTADARVVTLRRLQQRFNANAAQAQRIDTLAQRLWQSLTPGEHDTDPLLQWSAAVHEIGKALSHEDYHRHSAYMVEHADLYGFSEQERAAIGLLVLGHTGSLRKLDLSELPPQILLRLMCIRLAAIFCHGRHASVDALTTLALNWNGKSRFQLAVDESWLQARPLTALLLEEEMERWHKADYQLDLL